MFKPNPNYGWKPISSDIELLNYYTWLVSYLCNIEDRKEQAQEVIKVRKLIEEKMVDIT